MYFIQSVVSQWSICQSTCSQDVPVQHKMSLLLAPSSASRRIFPMLNRSHYKVGEESGGIVSRFHKVNPITKLLENPEDPITKLVKNPEESFHNSTK